MNTNVIRNPDNPDHYMQLDVMEQTVRILLGDSEVARSDKALRLLEAGRRLYQPQYYVPIDDVTAKLVRSEKSTHCPLKGDAAYFHLEDSDEGTPAQDLVWSYPEPLDFSAQLAGYVAFDPQRVTIIVEARN